MNGSTLTEDYNSFLQSGSTNPGTGAHDVVDATAPDPFVNWQAGNFNLASEESFWMNRMPLPSPYVTDPSGTERATDRGAYQYVSATQTTPVLTWATPAAITYGTALSSTQLNASATAEGSALAGLFAYSPAAGTVPGAGSQTLSVTFSPTDSTDYTTATASVTLVVNPAAQSIAFAAPASPVAVGVSPIALTATGGASGNPVVFSVVSGPASVSGNALTVSGVGTVVVAANQAGSADFAAAAQVTKSIVVNQGSQAIAFTAPASPVTYGVSAIALWATGGASNNPVIFTVVSGPASISGSTLTISGVGTVVVAANQAGNASYAAAPQVTQSIVVNQASQTINFTAPASPVTFGVAPIALTASGGASNNAVIFTVVSGPASISGNTLTISGVGTVVVAANQAGNASYAAAPQVTQSIVVNQASQTINFTAPASPVTFGVAPIALTATGGASSNAVSFTVVSGPASISGSTLTISGVGTVVVAANQAGNANYAAAPQVTQSIVVNQASQTINFTAPASPVTFGVAPIALTATGGASNNAVSFTVVSGPASISGNTLTISGVGTVVVAANQAGNASYAAAAQVTQSIVVNQASQTINFTAPASPVTFGVAPIALTATGGASSNAVSFTVVSGPASISGNTLTISGVGTVVVAANQAGNANYAAAPQVTQSIVVNQAAQSINFTAPASPVTFGVAPIALTASGGASSNAVSFTVVSGPASISGSMLTISGVGTVVVAANQAGNANYAAAPQVTQSIVVNQAAQSINFTAPASPVTFGVAPIGLTATGGASSNAVSFTVVSGPASISGSTLTISGVGTVVVAANQAGNANYAAAPQVTQSIVVNQAAQTINFAPLASPVTFGVSQIALSATGGASNNPVTFSVLSGPATVNGSVLTITGAGTVVVAADEASNANYSAAPEATQTITVNPAAQSISFAPLASPMAFGPTPIALSASGGPSGNPVSFSVVSGPAALSGNMLTLTGSGMVQVAANQAGSVNYAAAPQIMQSIAVNQAAQSISLAPLASPVVYGVGPIALAATGGASGNPVTFTVVSGPATVSGSTLAITGAGTVVVAANQAGTNCYAAAAQVTESVTVLQAPQSISFVAPASPVTYGVSPVALSATGGASGNPVVFSVVSGPATVSGSTLTITGPGTVVVAANQAGSANFAAAAPVMQSIAVNPPSTPVFTLVQKCHPKSTSSNTCTFANDVTPGDLVIGGAVMDNTLASTGVKDGAGNVFTFSPNSPCTGGSVSSHAWLFYQLASPGGANTNTVVFSDGNKGNVDDIWVYEFKVTGGTAEFDTDSKGCGSSTTSADPVSTLTLSGANELAYFVSYTAGGGTTGVGAPWTWWALQDSNLRLPPCEGGEPWNCVLLTAKGLETG
jgi:hypothetical protein